MTSSRVPRRGAFGAAALALCTTLVIAGCSTSGAIAPAAPVARSAFNAADIQRGSELAAIGNCITCHTAAGGHPLAGGFPVKTPFGTVHGTNLTPDPETGIGNWPEAAFVRAMREGIDREGRHLYPAFPYDHFTLVADDDLHALYAYLMTREPVRASIPANTIFVPRPLVAVWKALYFRRGASQAAASDARIARGQYLVDGLAHCGACHTPRNMLGAEKHEQALDGGPIEGWYAPALNAKSTSPVPWTVEALATYLRTGIDDAHAVSAGPMHGVTRNLAAATADDVTAMATYIVSLDTRDSAQRTAHANESLAKGARGRTPDAGAGALVYAGTCAQCHDRGRAAEGGALPLPLAIAPTLPTPANLVRIVRDGIVPGPDERFPWMPSYAGALSDDEVADVVAYVRTFTGMPPWSDVPSAVRTAGKERK